MALHTSVASSPQTDPLAMCLAVLPHPGLLFYESTACPRSVEGEDLAVMV